MVHGLSDEEMKRKFKNRCGLKMEIGHLIDLEELPIGRIEDLVTRKQELRAADIFNTKISRFFVPQASTLKTPLQVLRIAP